MKENLDWILNNNFITLDLEKYPQSEMFLVNLEFIQLRHQCKRKADESLFQF